MPAKCPTILESSDSCKRTVDARVSDRFLSPVALRGSMGPRHGAMMGAPDYAHWHRFFELMKDMCELTASYNKRIETGEIEHWYSHGAPA